ncbi:YkoY family integral membrane protein [Paenibacillus sp. 1182]|uniref:TerC family protein n=1 Tax=Paenibacillus sp. 1182 TaxID=2806565 RepID=UPI001AE0FF56|nr:hypothetical protein [Paenibacillus sp. 1182]MBP1308894.1 YkoY family integral membrane protein [Paenibacillus sp. 1182]
MGILHLIGETYAQFFDGKMWIDILTHPANWGLIATLVVMEGLLSADNAIALSLQVRHLPVRQQKKALMYGLWGAYLFRFIAIGLGTALTKLWFIKLIGGAYLLWMMISFFTKMYKDRKQNNTDDEAEESHSGFNKGSFLVRMFGVFWATIISVEMMDIAFSVDSVLAAFGISDLVGILLLGGMLGILMMRGVAQLFTKLLAKVPELEVTAYVLIGFIGLKMLLSTVHEIVALFGITMHEIHITHLQFFIFVALSFAATFIVNHFKKRKELLSS